MLFGTPVSGTAGSYPFTITAADPNGDTGFQNYILVVNPPLNVTLSLSPNSVAGGATTAGTVTLSGQPPSGEALIFLATSNSTAAPLPSPSYVFILPPATSGTFNITASNSVTSATSAIITASYNGVSATATLNVSTFVAPPPPPSISVMESIMVSDTPSFTDIPVSESITVSDQVLVTPILTNFAPPAAAFSNSSLGFGNTPGLGSAQTLTLSSVGGAPLVFTSAPMTSPGFALVAAICSDPNFLTSFSLPSGGQCAFTIVYKGGGPLSGAIAFFDNAALSNVSSTPVTGGYTQTIQLSAAGSDSAPLALPSTTVNIGPITENITVSDAPSGSATYLASQLSVKFQNTTYRGATKTVTTTAVLTNHGGSTLNGPFLLAFPGLPAGMTLKNASGTINGSPYIAIPAGTSLAPGQLLTSPPLTFNDPLLKTLTLTPVAYSGTF
jgi:hypothetical protein